MSTRRSPGYGSTFIALDPGKETGYALCSVHRLETDGRSAQEWGAKHDILGRRALRVYESGSASFGDLPGVLDGLTKRGLSRHELLSQSAGYFKDSGNGPVYTRPMFIVAEHFTLTANSVKGQSLWSSEIIGMARYIAAMSGGRIVLDDSQQPSSMKNLIHKNDVVRKTGLATKGMTPHEKDALGHAFLFATRLGGKSR